MIRMKVLPAVALFVFVLCAGWSPAYADHVVGEPELQKAVAERAAQTESDREAIQSLLRRPEVRKIAEHAGLELARAQASVTVLEAPTLQQLADQARQLERALAGGDTIVIGASTIIIILLIILIIVLVD